MKKAGVVGIGDMGSGIAKNLINAGFLTSGYDLDESRMEKFVELGGHRANSAMEVGRDCDAVFVMVMNGDQAKDVILGSSGLTGSMPPQSTILLTATIHPHEAVEIGQALEGTGINLIDTPVSGGYPGAQSGTLTLMAAAPAELLNKNADVLDAVSGSLHHVGSEPGMGQTIKACLQSLIGGVYSAAFETCALAAKAGIEGQILWDVVGTSVVGCPATKNSIQKIIDREFIGTGSHINTMYKDLTISMDFARRLGVPMSIASNAMQLFQAGKTKYPDGDCWIVTRVIEDIVGAELHRKET